MFNQATPHPNALNGSMALPFLALTRLAPRSLPLFLDGAYVAWSLFALAASAFMGAKLPKAMITIPQILGCDVAGLVLEADPSSKFKVGDRVVGCTGQIMDRWALGTYAEFVCCRENLLTAIPPGALAPSMPLAGKRVLVLGGAGGVGHFAVQETLTTAAGDPYDLVVDLVGDEPSCWGLLRRDGRMAVVSFDKIMQGRNGIWLVLLIMGRVIRLKLASALGLCPKYDSVMQDLAPEKGLNQLLELLAEGRVRVHVERQVTLEQVVEAHEHVERGRTRGKVVIRVEGSSGNE
ncbi:hypothetical protein VOLCADRAFT_90178 [Volvox carteri f. nagariensis]|uniref:Enoyl reductase (ER) domain-containing protein n=1 Tax=Volvox carteri f. nagariensis TaxID=3068 RepID=D8TTP5_VOLCA|nr:uncharacterized protein VOLCADRAFT_90178 [Volvox carteri f. nagariensis]EFJ49233.1 hypothetical protein VOLCADRAFT_90178 [Volvox carteri f. nagariensis]|eukprot:XP_002949681.1 hypothetical protein VOLCADRAFT_90178 [Volvox carteri f. nagariensis]